MASAATKPLIKSKTHPLLKRLADAFGSNRSALNARDPEFIERAGLLTLGPLGEKRSLIAPMPAEGFAHSARDLPELAPAIQGATVLFH